MEFGTAFCKSYCCLFKQVYDAEYTGFCCCLKRSAFQILTTLIDLTESYNDMNKDVEDTFIPTALIKELRDVIDSTALCILEYLHKVEDMCFPCTVARYQLISHFEKLIF